MKLARTLTLRESRRVDLRGRHVVLRVERPERTSPFLVMRCPLGHEYAWHPAQRKQPGWERMDLDFLASWWSEAKGGVTAARNSCPECPRA